MGANATTFVPAYVSGEVLTAADLTVTNSGIPVFADSTARTAAFGGTGEKVLAEGQYAYLESDNSTSFYDGAAWQPVGVAPGLVLIKTQTIGTTVSSVTVSDAFSATYDNYLVTVSGGVASTNTSITFQMGATVTGYYYGGKRELYDGTTSTQNGNNVSSVQVGVASANTIDVNCTIFQPNTAKRTSFMSQCAITLANGSGFQQTNSGFVDTATQYTAFTVIGVSGTLTGGVIRVYGYANS